MLIFSRNVRLAALAPVAALLIAAPAVAAEEETIYIYGAIKDPTQVQAEDPADRSMPELPVVYEDEKPAKPEPKPSDGKPSGA